MSKPTGSSLRLIGLTGRAGSGKDTAFDLLVSGVPTVKFQRKAFADLLKRSAMLALGLDPKDADHFKDRGTIKVLFGQDEAKTLTGREYLQRYGLEAHREVFGHDFWTKRVLTDEVLGNSRVTVITDVRMDNEAETIRELGGQVWRIEKDDEPTDMHPTEQGVSEDLVDVVIHNVGSVDELQMMVCEAFGAARCNL